MAYWSLLKPKSLGHEHEQFWQDTLTNLSIAYFDDRKLKCYPQPNLNARPILVSKFVWKNVGVAWLSLTPSLRIHCFLQASRVYNNFRCHSKKVHYVNKKNERRKSKCPLAGLNNRPHHFTPCIRVARSTTELSGQLPFDHQETIDGLQCYFNSTCYGYRT